jgi:hypothetical protein
VTDFDENDLDIEGDGKPSFNRKVKVRPLRVLLPGYVCLAL